MLVASFIAESNGMLVHTVGASGVTMGLMLAYGVMFPNRRLMLVLPPMEVSSRTLVIAMVAISVIAGVTGTMQGIAHFAHLGGMLFGWLLLRYWSGKPPFGKRKPPRPRLVR
jgi:membrane associated rhomboid family serine protease